MDNVDRVIEAANKYYKQLRDDKNARFRSWEHCYKCFHDARDKVAVDYDYLCLQLAFYLASWGMYRGSSFLLQKDYKVHEPVVKELLDSKYNCLFGLECKMLKNNEVQEKLQELESFMKDKYKEIRKDVYERMRKDTKKEGAKNELSTVLITKILMGTFGCVPAYDRFFIDGVTELSVATGKYSKESRQSLADFYEKNREKLEAAKNNMKVYDLPYPQMKLLDMAFWQIGFEKNKQNRKIEVK